MLPKPVRMPGPGVRSIFAKGFVPEGSSKLVAERWRMFGLGLPEILVILLIFFFIFGAKRLPAIGEGLGKTIKELRKIRDERKAEKGKEEKNQKEDMISDLRKEVSDIPGLKEARKIKETADQFRRLRKLIK